MERESEGEGGRERKQFHRLQHKQRPEHVKRNRDLRVQFRLLFVRNVFEVCLDKAQNCNTIRLDDLPVGIGNRQSPLHLDAGKVTRYIMYHDFYRSITVRSH